MCESRCTQCKVVINELLAFVSNKVDPIPETGIIQICLSAYTSEEIETARSIANKLMAPTKKFKRRKEGGEQKSVQDIIKLIKEFEPDCLPMFVAKNLNKLPAVSFFHIDIVSFLKEMTLLRNDVACLKAKPAVTNQGASSDIDAIKNEIDDVKKMLTELREAHNTSNKRQEDLFRRSYHNDKNARNNAKNSSTNTSAGIVELEIEVPCTGVSSMSVRGAAGGELKANPARPYLPPQRLCACPSAAEWTKDYRNS